MTRVAAWMHAIDRGKALRGAAWMSAGLGGEAPAIPWGMTIPVIVIPTMSVTMPMVMVMVS